MEEFNEIDKKRSALVAKFFQDMAALEPIDTAGLEATGRDPNREWQLRGQVNALLMIAVGGSTMFRDVGIPAAVMEVNTIGQENFARVADAYWRAKGL